MKRKTISIMVSISNILCLVFSIKNFLVSLLNNGGIAAEDGPIIEKEAREVAAFLGPHRCLHTGLHTGNADADLVLDNGQTIELKRVSSGSGTYYNTSIYHMTKYGFNFKDYLREFGLYDVLKDNFSNLSISEKK